MEPPSSSMNPRVAGNATVTNEKVRRSVAWTSRPSEGLALCSIWAKANKSGPDLAPDQENLGPREREVMMSAALVSIDRVYSSLTKYRRRGLIGRRHTTNFHRPASHLASLCRNESEILGARKFITNMERNCRGRLKRLGVDPKTSCQEISRLHVTQTSESATRLAPADIVHGHGRASDE